MTQDEKWINPWKQPTSNNLNCFKKPKFQWKDKDKPPTNILYSWLGTGMCKLYQMTSLPSSMPNTYPWNIMKLLSTEVQTDGIFNNKVCTNNSSKERQKIICDKLVSRQSYNAVPFVTMKQKKSCSWNIKTHYLRFKHFIITITDDPSPC